MSYNLTEGAIEAIVNGDQVDEPILQIISSKLISSGGSSDRYRLLLSDGRNSYSHAMLATQLNGLMEQGQMDKNTVVKVQQYICNTLAADRKIVILLALEVLAKGEEVGGSIGSPQPLKPRTGGAAPATTNGTTAPAPATSNTAAKQNTGGQVNSNARSPPPNKQNYQVKAGGSNTPGTPGSNRIHSIASLTPYQNRWRIRARVTQKGNIRTWSNSRGEGRLFSVNLLDESGEIRCTGFNESIDRFYELLEVNKVYYVSKAQLKTANKQYSSVKNDYEMTFNNDTVIEQCDEQTDLPSITFDFIQIDQLETKQANSCIDVLGVVRSAGETTTVIGKQSQKEVTKREVQLVDQSGMVVNLTLWGSDAEQFHADGNPVVACKGCKLSDWGGRSLSLLGSSQMIVNPDIREAALLKGWWSREGQNREFQGYRSEGAGAGGASTNWKLLGQLKNENIGQDKPEYFTSKGTIIFLRKENCMYQACPSENCNKKVVDQGNGMYRCEKCNQEYPKFKWRMILSVNLADHTGQQWVTCFQDSAELVLGTSAQELGSMKDSNEAAFDQVFSEASFKSYIFKMRAKVETYNDESRLKTVCMNATPIDFVQDGQRLINEINSLLM